MNQDDDSILDRLLNELDIDSALSRLERIGFVIVSQPNEKKKYYHLNRSKEDRTDREDVFIQVNSRNHFLVKYACQGLVATYPDIITSWDDWVAFFRQLIFKHPSLKRKIEHQCDISKDDQTSSTKAATKRLKCAEQ